MKLQKIIVLGRMGEGVEIEDLTHEKFDDIGCGGWCI